MWSCGHHVFIRDDDAIIYCLIERTTEDFIQQSNPNSMMSTMAGLNAVDDPGLLRNLMLTLIILDFHSAKSFKESRTSVIHPCT